MNTSVYTTINTRQVRIGQATKNDDGSIRVDLEAIPVNGKLVVACASPPPGAVEEARDAVERLIDELLAAKSKAVCASIDAGACGTPCDYRAAREAEENFQTVRERVVEQLAKV